MRSSTLGNPGTTSLSATITRPLKTTTKILSIRRRHPFATLSLINTKLELGTGLALKLPLKLNKFRRNKTVISWRTSLGHPMSVGICSPFRSPSRKSIKKKCRSEKKASPKPN